MPSIPQTYEYTITAGGGTLSLDVFDIQEFYILNGAVTLTSNLTIQPTGTPILGTTFHFSYEAKVLLNGNTITVFGETMPAQLSGKTHKILATWNGSTWEVDFIADVSEDNIIPMSSIEDSSFEPLINGGVFTLQNGLNSPMLTNVYNPVSEVTTDSNLYVRGESNTNVLELIGEVNVKLDETFSVSDVLETVTQLSTGPNDLEDFELPITLVCNDITAPLLPVRTHYVQGILYYTASSGDLMLHVKGSEKSIVTVAEYKAQINLKLKYL